MFLAGDAGHIVPPTGAKGLNLAATDVNFLSNALIQFYKDRTEEGIDAYSERCLSIDFKLQQAELDYLMHSESGSRSIAEN
jgi:p-hydroxybenzoate 3-monooxygenase